VRIGAGDRRRESDLADRSVERPGLAARVVDRGVVVDVLGEIRDRLPAFAAASPKIASAVVPPSKKNWPPNLDSRWSPDGEGWWEAPTKR
jgi:hypothetical protein